jgi:hypothetical protein
VRHGFGFFVGRSSAHVLSSEVERQCSQKREDWIPLT